MNQLSAPERETILGLLRLRWSSRRICRETGHRHETVRRIGQEAGLLQPRAPAAKPHTLAEVLTDLVAPANVAPAAKVPSRSGRSSIGVHAERVEAEVAKGRNAVAIYQDLVEHHGYTGSYDSVKRFARRLRASSPKVSCRFETPPCQEAQVDYGEDALTRNPRTGKF